MNKNQELSGKSLEFVKKRIASGECGDMKNNDYSFMYEVNFNTIFDIAAKRNSEIKTSENTWEHNFTALYDDGQEKEMKVIIEYNPDMQFEYFTMEQCICDGTSYFYFELCEKVLGKLLIGKTYYKPKFPDNYEDEMEKYIIKYTVGDFVFADEFGEEFAAETEPWMYSRFSVMLPIRCDFIKKFFR